MEPPTVPPSILIVDDTPVNLQVLTALLQSEGYRARPVPSGRLALLAARSDVPDLILLDVNMPEMNGYDVCEQLKLDARLKDVPVIFISGLSDTADKVKAFSSGAMDYITKPFQFEEVRARVETHLKLRRLQLELKKQNQQLQESYDRLRQLESLRDNLTHMIVHDMRTPLLGITGFLELLELSEWESTSDKGKKYIRQAQASTENLVEMVSSLLDIHKMEAGEMKLKLATCELGCVTQGVLTKLEALKGNRVLCCAFPAQPVSLVCDVQLIGRVIQNLLGNAIKFTSAESGDITIGIEASDGKVVFRVQDNGPGIPEQYQCKVFEKFASMDPGSAVRQYSTGLGLHFCKLAVEAHGGRIGVESLPGHGSKFWFELPVNAGCRAQP